MNSYNHQLEPLLPINIVKRYIRCCDCADVTFNNIETKERDTTRINIASDFGGSLITYIERGTPLYDSIIETDSAELELQENESVDRARVNITCRCEILLDNYKLKSAEERYESRHGSARGNAQLVFMTPQQIQLVSVGEQYEIECNDICSEPDQHVIELERRIVHHVNEDHDDAVRAYAEILLQKPEDDWRLISLDMDGLDLASKEKSCRLWFNPPLSESGEIKNRLVKLAMSAGL